MTKKQKKSLQQILIALALVILLKLLLGVLPALPTPVELLLYLIPYLVVGKDVLRKAIKGVKNRQPFDECFLMAVATVGAFALGDYVEGCAVILFYQIGELFQSVAVGKSRQSISSLMDIRPDYANVEDEDGKLEQVDPDDVEVGTVIVVQPGERVPIDGVIVEGTSALNTAALTGESLPRDVQTGDEVISGCVNMTGLLKVRTTKEFGESTVSKILDLVENSSMKKARAENFITRFARVYTPAVCYGALALAFLPPIVLLLMGQPARFGDWIYRALTFLVISCPCALVLSVPLSFFAGIGAASKQGILFKGGIAMEQMKHIGAVVFDKTGTITKGNFVVHQVVPADNRSADDVLCLCASAEQASNHPIARSVVAQACEQGLSLTEPSEMEEIAGQGLKAQVGSHSVLCGNRQLMDTRHIILPAMDDVEYGSELYVAIDGAYAGRLVISDTIKEDAVDAVKAISRMGITTAMLTGDSRKAADYIASKTGIDDVRAKLLPQDKVNQMDALRKQYGPVLFVGDGINDAPVLAGADVGVAMGSGADAAVEAADVVFMQSRVSAVPAALHLSRETMKIAMENVVFALGVKGVVMIAGFAGYASMWAAVFADSGVAALCVLNSVRMLYKK